ncbi:MAG TPA: plastocyanin/azurin family copper-binding protein [Vicinamibacterales bacterium]|nr:plastocyanin/azurin family copper-binding protein [Vicinamibacterales bacterium]
MTAVLAGLVLVPAARPVVAAQTKPAPATAAAAPRLVVLTVTDPVGEKMSYSKSVITAKPGERLKVRLISMGQLPRTVMTHNFVLLTLGSDPKKFSEAAALTPATGYIPAALKSQILAQADMVGPGEQSEVVFTAPKAPGSYPFLCTFAAHFGAGMSGTLVVK